MKMTPGAFILVAAAAICLLPRTPARCASAPVQAPRDLASYIARPEPAYAWKDAGTETAVGDASAALPAALPGGEVTIRDLTLTSQQWQGVTWTHRVRIFRPARPRFPDTALVQVTYGGPSPRETALGRLLASATGATFVVLSDIPNQPLWDRREDDLISYTFARYFETGDATWPLLLPMTKSVIKTMDALGEWSRREDLPPLRRFVISGASKRGWTTWLSAATGDRRVIGIIPMVFDNLHFARQMPHQLETWGAYSEQIADYTRRGLQALLGSPRGQTLTSIVDPWMYRERITIPKLIINGTNDAYWTLDSLNLYRDDLKGLTNVLYAPNAGHSLAGQEMRVLGASAGWFRRVAEGKPVPAVALSARKGSEAGGARHFTLTATPGAEAKTARLWVARSATKDFRKAKWEETPLQSDKAGVFLADVAPGDPALPYAAAFGEIEAESSPLPLYLSSSVVLWKTP